MDNIKEELVLPKDQKSLLIYDVFKGQTTKRYIDFLLENNTDHLHVPANLIHEFQPLDVNVNGVAKGFLKDKFQTWYTDEIQKQMHNGKGIWSSRWVFGLYDKLRNSEK